MKRLTFTFAALLALMAAAVFTAAGCGSSSHKESTGNVVDKAFASEMTGHHQGALDMANLAKQRAQHTQIRGLADSIVSTQTAEISQLKTIGKDIGAEGSEHGGHDMSMGGSASMDSKNLSTLGLSADQAGMMHDMKALEAAKPFDRGFIDMMLPHHQGAIRMARVELARGKNPKLKALAQEIIAAQSREIGQMSSWRRGWYGSPPPTGGVPA